MTVQALRNLLNNLPTELDTAPVHLQVYDVHTCVYVATTLFWVSYTHKEGFPKALILKNKETKDPLYG